LKRSDFYRTENLKKKNWNKSRRISDFEKNGGIEQRNGKPKKKNYNKPRKISDFEQNGGIEQQKGKTKKTNFRF